MFNSFKINFHLIQIQCGYIYIDAIHLNKHILDRNSVMTFNKINSFILKTVTIFPTSVILFDIKSSMDSNYN